MAASLDDFKVPCFARGCLEENRYLTGPGGGEVGKYSQYRCCRSGRFRDLVLTVLHVEEDFKTPFIHRR